MEGDRKEYPTTGKVALAAIIGDRTILKAMSANETAMADDHASKNSSANAEAQVSFRKAHADERGKRTGWVQRA